jgi:thiamine biosynthesis lipoprotein ApbE
MADALSTGLSILPWDEARRVLARHEGVDGIFVDAAGEKHIHASLTAQAGAPARPLNGK